MQTLHQAPAGLFDIGYRPKDILTHTESSLNTITLENPPRFSFMPHEDGCRYIIQISKSDDFVSVKEFADLEYNFFTPDIIFEPGTYYWRYAVYENNCVVTEWSQIRAFNITGEEAKTPLIARNVRYDKTAQEHPRLWMTPCEIETFKSELKKNPSHCGFDSFYKNAVIPYKDLSTEKEPPFNKDWENQKLRHNDFWRGGYIYCQEVMYKIKHLAIAGRILEDAELLHSAKQSLLQISAWNPNGSSSEEQNDEAAYRVLRAMAWGYDWLYDLLSQDEKNIVKNMMLERLNQIWFRNVVDAKIHQTPFASHPVRSLSMVMMPCSIALMHDTDEIYKFLNYSFEFLATLYSPWGGADGGWAEGGAYWTTGMASVTEGLSLSKKYFGIDLLQRPFFQKTGDFILYCYSPYMRNASFGDQSNLGGRPPLKTAFLMREFAGISGNMLYMWYYNQMLPWDTSLFSVFYNRGWWNFYFDDLAFQHEYGSLAEKQPTDIAPVKWFKDIGWVAMHHNMNDRENHIALLFKSSPYGSISHSHGDQNGFIIHAFDEPMAIESGYYVSFGSEMHSKWRRQTKSTNNILVDNIGQYAEKDKLMQIESNGSIVDVGFDDRTRWLIGNASNAYKQTVPYLENYTRKIIFVDNAYFVIIDTVITQKESQLSCLLHSLKKYEIHNQSAVMNGEKADMYVDFVCNSTGNMIIEQTDSFGDIDYSEIKGLPSQWHLTAKTNKSKKHNIVTLIVPVKKGTEKEVSYTVNGNLVTFTHKGQDFKYILEEL